MERIVIRNVSEGYGIILGTQLAPGDVLDLQEEFVRRCKPKKSSKAEPARFAEYKEDQLEEFLDFAEEKVRENPNKWRIEGRTGSATKVTTTRKVEKATSPASNSKRVVAGQRVMRVPSAKSLSPKELAWLPYDNNTKEIIGDFRDLKILKSAYKLVRNLAGQERVRRLIEDRLNELAAE
jgi:hypothetical protein